MTAPAHSAAGPLARPGPWARIAGLGSIYGKTIRDSLRAAILVGGVCGLFMVGTGAPFGVAPEFGTIELRRQFIAGLTSLPIAVRGLLGEPINLETLGGFLSWRVGNFLPVILALWPIVALSGTLAGEAAKGSLDLLASTPRRRSAIAIEKVSAHLTAIVIAMLILAASLVLVGAAFAKLPGDPIAVSAALGQVVMYGVMMLFPGAVAFAAGPRFGRTRAMAFGFIVLFASYVIYSYASLSPLIDALSPISFWNWTVHHRPLAGITDWPAVVLQGVVDLALLGIGAWSFQRRDLGITASDGWLRLPALPAGVIGPVSRQLADRAGVAIAWGIGIGLYGVLIAASAQAFSDSIGAVPQIAAIIRQIYPGIDISQPSGVLQLTFFSFGSFIFSLAGASFLAGWAADEGRKRLDVVLSTPRSRSSWAVRSGLGVLAAIGIMTIIVAACIGLTVVAVGGDVVSPVGGIAVLGLVAAAFAAVGLAIGGLVRSSLAAGVTAFLAIATFLIDTLGAALKLPDWVLQLSIYKHLGQPMAGSFEPVGLVVAAVLVVAGVALCAFGLQRRDIGR